MSRPSRILSGVIAPALYICLLGLALLSISPATAATTMMSSVDAAFAYNPELKASQENRRASMHAVERARAGYLPTVAGYAGGGGSSRNDSTTRSYGEDKDFRAIADAGVRLTQPLWHGGATSADVATRTARYEAADSLLEDRGASLAFDAIVAHTEVVRRRDLVRLAEGNVREHARILTTVRQRFSSGVATVGELNQIQSRHARARATLSSYASALDAAKANYLRITGKNPVDLAPATEAKSRFSGLDEVRQTCLDNNSQIKASLAEVRAAKGEKDHAQSRFFPRFDFQTGPSWSDRQSDANLHTTEFAAEVRMNWEFFSGGADKAAVNMGNARIRQARQNLHALMNALNEDIEATHSRYLSSAAQIGEYVAARKASRTAREDYYRQFLQAQRSLIDVLDAENDYFYAASQEVLCRGDRLVAGYRLLALSGVLLAELRINPALLRIDSPTTSQETDPSIRFGFPTPLHTGQGNAGRGRTSPER